MLHQSAFEGNSPFLKGGLHTHTTRSDGWADPAVVIRHYHALGYNFLALTDHNIYNYKNFAPDMDMLILPGMERDHSLPTPGTHCFHTVCLGPEEGMGNQFKQDDCFPGHVPVQDQAAYQPILDGYHAMGNITLYCHPEWSSTPAREFEKLKGNFAMEIWNSGCALENELDDNAAYWDELLLKGIHISGAATDDSHDISHCGLGYVLVKAERNIPSILQALKTGAFYSSCGPEIYDFYIDDGHVVLECSPCLSAGFCHGLLSAKLTRSSKGDVTKAVMKLPEYCNYIRGVVKDSAGRRAWTNPIYIK